MSKFIRQILGPVHFETRFLPFIENNKDTLHNYIYLVNNYELYEPYKDLLTILDIEEVRKNHDWSKEKEILFNEIDPTLHIKNFKDFCIHQKNHLILNTARFLFPHMYENNILNFTFIQNNIFMTNKQYEIDNYFNSIPAGTITIPHLGSHEARTDDTPYVIAGDKLKEKFPNLIFPQDCYYTEGFIFGFNFLEKEHIKLFYEMWDILSYEFQTKYPQHLYMQSGNIGYCVLDPVVAYIARIFEVNFNYKIKNYLEYWNNEKLGFHVTCPHDAWYYSLNVLPGWNLHHPSEEDKIYTIKDYIKKNKDNLINYYQNHIPHCNFKITEDNQIILTHKNL